MNKIIEELRSFFLQNHIPVFGVAESGLLENEPAGYRPSDMLSSALSIISFGFPVPKGLFLDEKRVNMNYWRMASVYYKNLDIISSRAALIIESHNEIASPVLS